MFVVFPPRVTTSPLSTCCTCVAPLGLDEVVQSVDTPNTACKTAVARNTMCDIGFVSEPPVCIHPPSQRHQHARSGGNDDVVVEPDE